MIFTRYQKQLKEMGILKRSSICYDCRYTDNVEKCKECSNNYKNLFRRKDK